MNEHYNKFLTSQLYKNQSPNLVKLGFDFSNNPQKEYEKIQKLLMIKYHIECESMLTIMKEFKIPSSKTMDILFKHFNIQSRSFSEASKKAWLQQRSNNIPPGFPSIKQAWHTDWQGNQHFLRSSYELDFAEILDEQKIEYHVESLRILYYASQREGWFIAIPDFYLPVTNEIVEIKANHWYDEIDILDRKSAFEKLGYKFRLILDKEEKNLL